MMFGLLLTTFLIFSATIVPYVGADTVATCQPRDFHYEYTECDSKGGRWRVSVPTPGTCVGGAPAPPIRGTNCSFICEAGHYLNLDTQSCTKCPAGTYSLGDSVRYDSWDSIPKDFSVESSRFIVDQSMDMFSDDDSQHAKVTENANCTNSEWTAAGDYVMVVPHDCSSTLVYARSLVRPGLVTFEYQHTNPTNFFKFSVQNDKCQSLGDKNANKWPKVTKNGHWYMVKAALKTGPNVLSWKVMNFGLDAGVPKPVLIRNIQISGIAYTSACPACKPGTYSVGGTDECKPCPENTYSGSNASSCVKCDAVTEYSLAGASRCVKRPACGDDDHFGYNTPCDKNKTTRVEYDWMKPHVCRTDLVGSVPLPKPGAKKQCPACNKGMYSVDDGSGCRFCAHEEYSDGTKACAKCPPSTSPQFGHDSKWWYEMQPNMTTDCLSTTKSGCATKEAWIPLGDHIQSGQGKYDDSYLLLSLDVKGFHTKSKNEVNGKLPDVGTVEFVFDTECESRCYFLLALERGDEDTVILKTWAGRQARQKFTYSLVNPGPVTFTWAFQKVNLVRSKGTASDVEPKMLSTKRNRARIYSIRIANTLDGGVISCTPCPIGVQSDGCVPCPAGHYVDNTTSKCTPCPAHTVVTHGNAWGVQACRACGEGLVARDGAVCVSDCVYKAPNGRKYDFSPLATSSHSVEGSRLFTAGGAKYYHNFNITLCPGGKRPLVTCVRNISSELQPAEIKKDPMFVKQEEVRAAVCRATIIPQQGESTSVLSAHPVSLGDELTEIFTNNDTLASQYEKEGFNTKGIKNDINFVYKSDKSTSSCANGRTTVLSMHCDIKAAGNGTIRLPPKCQDGTCDGCNFHLVWHTMYACPICADDDYTVIIGECVAGEQTLHYYPPTTCLSTTTEPTTKKRACSMLPFSVKIGLIVGAAIGVILCIVLFYCWKHNRRLEYKYMKLVQNASTKDDELPAADTCALHEGEDEHDHGETIAFSSNKGIRLVKKFMDRFGTKDKDSFEEYHLTESESLT